MGMVQHYFTYSNASNLQNECTGNGYEKVDQMVASKVGSGSITP